MAASTATDNQDQRHQDNSRMTIADIPKTTLQRHHHQKQQQQQTLASAKTLHTLLGIAEDQHMELSQIELIYRAEGNANLVLALPQFKKVLRLPKMLPTTSSNTTSTTQQQKQQQHQSASDPALNQNAKACSDELTMVDFVAYIEIIRNLLGNEFVFETDIVHIPRAQDRICINENIKKDRPAHRLDKEFCGEFGLLLPDATHLPIAFDILLCNLQVSLAALLLDEI